MLTPFALGLLSLLLLPVIAHMARQQPKVRTPFGAMMLLARVVKRLRRRRRLNDWILFLLRCLAFMMLVLGAAQPQCRIPEVKTDYGGSGRAIFIIDRSMSMGMDEGGKTLLQRAKSDAREVLQGLPEGTLIGGVVFGDETVRLVSGMSTDRRRMMERIDSTEVLYEGSNFRSALLETRRLLAGEPGDIFVFSDEAGPLMFPEAKREIRALMEKGSVFIPRPVHADPPRNVAVSHAEYGDGLEGGTVSLTLFNYGPDPVEVPCEVVLPDGQNIPIFVELPGETEVVERITVPREARGGVGRASCEDGVLGLDDSRFFHLPRVGASRVLVVDGNPGDTPSASEVYYLERALAPWGGRHSGVMPDVVTPAGLDGLNTSTHQVVFLSNVADPRSISGQLIEFVRGGGGLVITLGDNVTAERYNGALGGVLPSLLRKPRALTGPGELGIPLVMPDVGHPLFQTFRRSGRIGFSNIRSQRVFTLEPFKQSDEVTTLLSYAGGNPALVERKIGNGRVLVWTSSVDWDWSNMPLQAIFMPFVQRLVGYLGGEAGTSSTRVDGRVGELVQIPLHASYLEPTVVGPDGEVRSRIEGSTLLFTPTRPGAYEIQVDDAPTLSWVAVNTVPLESDVRRSGGLVRAQRDIDPEQMVRKLDLAPYLLWLSFAFLVVQGVGWKRRIRE